MTLPPGDNSGIQNINSTIHGPQAAGHRARATSHGTGAPAAGDPAGDQAARAELLRALRELRAELERLRAERPGALTQGDAADAAHALDGAQAEASAAAPQPGRLRRCLTVLTDALTGVAGLAAAVGAVEGAAEPVIRSLGG